MDFNIIYYFLIRLQYMHITTHINRLVMGTNSVKIMD